MNEDMFFFNPVDLILKMLSANGIISKMYIGLGLFVDAPSEL